MLKIENLSIKASDKEILNNINLKINDGEIHVIMGPNGIGKSTLCHTIMGSDDYTISRGSIYYNEELLNNLDPSLRAKLGIYEMFQNPPMIEGVTNSAMIRAALTSKTGEHIDIFKFNKELKEVASKLKIDSSFIHREVNVNMSGGEKKKNEMLNLWMLKPNFIMLDELDSGLDVDSIKTVMESLKEYIDNHHPSVLIITHNTKILEYLKPDYVHVINDQTIVKTGNIDLAYEIEKNGFNHLSKSFKISENETYE